MLLLRCSKVPSLQVLGVSRSLLFCRPPLSSITLAVSRNLTTIATRRRLSSGRLSSIDLMTDLEGEIFNYTTGRFLVNETYQLRERRRVFDVPRLFKLIAKAINCRTEQIIDFRKIGEGGFNRIFLITLDNDFQLIARIPYPLLVAKAYAIASEVATMDFLRSKGLPIPKVYAYSFTSTNDAKTEYILMEYINGIDLSQIWESLKEDEITSFVDQLKSHPSCL